MTFLKLQGEAGGRERATRIPLARRAVRGEGEDVRGLLMGKEGWKRTCPPGTTSPVLRHCVSCPSVAVQSLAQTGWAEPGSTSCPHGAGSGCPHSLAGAAGKSWRRREGGDLKIVPISFLQLSFTVRKRARGLPAPVHTTPYIMGDAQASLRAGNRQGCDIYTALPKPMSSSWVPGPWKQPLGWGKQLVWLGRGNPATTTGWGGGEGEQGAARR